MRKRNNSTVLKVFLRDAFRPPVLVLRLGICIVVLETCELNEQSPNPETGKDVLQGSVTRVHEYI